MDTAQVQETKKKSNKSLIFAACVAFGLIVAMGFTMVGLSSSLGNLSTEISKTKTDIVLANADIEDDTLVAVPILYFDQKADACVNMYEPGLKSALESRQFEWTSCDYINYGLEQGIVADTLGADYLPVALGGQFTSNQGVKGDNFTRWFKAVDGKSKNIPSVLNLTYHESKASFDYDNDKFYPVDGVGFKDAAADGHNHLFTLNLGIPIRLMKDGDQNFEITADDDTFVFVNDRLALDMGGIHEPIVGALKITETGEVRTSVGGEDFAFSGINVNDGNAIIRVFHADRDSKESVFKMHFSNMVLSMTDATLAKTGEGVAVAYDPTDPTYVAPLGESMSYEANHSRTMLMASVIQAAIVGMLAVILIAVVSVVMKRADRKAE